MRGIRFVCSGCSLLPVYCQRRVAQLAHHNSATYEFGHPLFCAHFQPFFVEPFKAMKLLATYDLYISPLAMIHIFTCVTLCVKDIFEDFGELSSTVCKI